MLQQINNSIELYANKRTWWLYIPLCIWFCVLFISHVRDPFYQNMIFSAFNLVIHEAGHYAVFAWFGNIISVIGGSLLEALFPVIFLLAFVKQKDYFGITFCLGWLATSLFGTATYIGDAQEMFLPLLGGDSTIHDWNYILTHYNILHLDDRLAALTRFVATAFLGITIIAQAFLIMKMHTLQKISRK